MASTDALPVPRKNTAFRVTFPILDNTGALVTGAAGLDSEVSKDGGTFADCTSEATEIATSSGMYFLDLTSTEMNADTVAVIVKTSTTDAKTSVLVFYPQETGDIRVDVDTIKTNPVVNGGTITFPTGATLASTTNITAGTLTTVTTATNVTTVNGLAAGVITAASIAADAITDAKVAADVTIASVTGSVGSVTGAVGSVTGAVGSVTAMVTANAIQISGDSVAADNLEAMLDGTGGVDVNIHTLTLAGGNSPGLAITSTGDNAVAINSTDGAGIAIVSAGQYGISVVGGDNGIYSIGNNSHGFYCAGGVSGGTGDGFYALGGVTSGSGIYAKGQGNNVTDSGIYGASFGTIGSGIYGEAKQAGHGLWVESEGNGHGILACSDGTGNGMKLMAGTSGHGLHVLGGSTGGDGAHFAAQAGNADGLQAAKHGTGADIRADITGSLSGSIGSITGLTISGLENMQTRWAGMTVLDGAVYQYTANALELAPSGGSAPTVGEIADAVWDEALAGHLGAGSTGLALNSAGAAGDPWSTTLPGAYGAGSAGLLLGTTIPGLLQDAEITHVSPVATDGGTVTIIRGDDYNNSTSPSTALSWSFTGVPSLTGATVLFRMAGESDITMTVASATSAYFELTDTQSDALMPGDYKFDIVATLSGGTITRTLVYQGTVRVKNPNP